MQDGFNLRRYPCDQVVYKGIPHVSSGLALHMNVNTHANIQNPNKHVARHMDGRKTEKDPSETVL